MKLKLLVSILSKVSFSLVLLMLPELGPLALAPICLWQRKDLQHNGMSEVIRAMSHELCLAILHHSPSNSIIIYCHHHLRSLKINFMTL